MSNKFLTPEWDAQFRHDLETVLLVKGPLLELKLSRLDAWMLMTGIQLALRHPKNIGPTSVVLRSIAERLIGLVATTPTLRELAMAGFNPDFDVDQE